MVTSSALSGLDHDHRPLHLWPTNWCHGQDCCKRWGWTPDRRSGWRVPPTALEDGVWECPEDPDWLEDVHLAMDQLPINTIFRGMTIHLPAILMFTRGTRFWHTATYYRVTIGWLDDTGWFFEGWIQDRPGKDSYSRYAIFDAEYFRERGDGILQYGNGKVMVEYFLACWFYMILWSSCFHFLHTQMFVARRNHSLAVCAQQRKEVQPQFSASQLCRAPTSTPLWGPRYFRGNWWNGGRQLWNTGGIWWNLYWWI